MQFIRKINITYLFIFIQMILYTAFLTLDLSGGSVIYSTWIKFSIIVLCFCFALLYQKNDINRSMILYIRTALLFTVVSDLCILLLDYYLYGVISFIVVQQIYGILLARANHTDTDLKRIPIRNLIIRIVCQILLTVVICLILQQLGITIENLLVVTAFYFISIVTNVINSVKVAIRLKKRNYIIFSVGMVLFLLCDINVGLFNMAEFIPLSESIYHTIYAFSSILMWTFYAPSQVFIALSVAGTSKSA